MKIEPKYNIGQEVWFFYFGYKPFRDIITHKKIVAIGNGKDVVIYRTKNFSSLAEYELFHTKKELLESL
jgi:hypothetical protein